MNAHQPTPKALTADEETFLRQIRMWCGRPVQLEAGTPEQKAARALCVQKGFVTFDGHLYQETALGRAEFAKLPPVRFIDLVAMKEYERWVGTPTGLDFWSRHELATRWAARRDDRFDNAIREDVAG